MLTGLTSTLSDGATAWMTPNWTGPMDTAASRRTATRVTPGAIALSSSSHFPLMLYSKFMKPVALPPGPDDTEFQARVGAFLQGLQQAGWTIGRNVRIDTRWATTDAAEIRRHAAELAALAPDVILAHGSSTVGPLLQATRTVPIVFPVVADPVGAGIVDSLARPGGNVTGLMTTEYGIGTKWLELLKEIAPGVTRVAVLRDPAIASGSACATRPRSSVSSRHSRAPRMAA